jgi:hypothetical protein
MTDEQLGAAGGELEAHHASRGREKRGSRRQDCSAPFRMRVDEADLHGAARNIGGGGIYVVTGDELRVQIVLRDANGSERSEVGRIVRLEHLASGTFGVAIELDR